MCLTYVCVYGVWSHAFVYVSFLVGIANISMSTEMVYVHPYAYIQVPEHRHMSVEVNT